MRMVLPIFQFLLGLALRSSYQIALSRVCKPQVGQVVLLTARVQRGESTTARCASTGDKRATLLSPSGSFLLSQVIKHSSHTSAGADKLGVYEEYGYSFRMVLGTESLQDAQKGRPARPQPMKAPEA